MEYKFIILPIVVGLLLPSVAIPWVVINLFGYHPFSPLSVLEEVSRESKSNEQMYLLDITAPFKITYTGIILSTILYTASIPAVVAALIWKKHRSILTLTVALLCISSGLIFFYSIDSFRTNFAKIAASTGGLIAGEWKGQESAIVNRIISIGMGQYLVIAAGILAAIAWLMPKIHSRSQLRPNMSL